MSASSLKIAVPRRNGRVQIEHALYVRRLHCLIARAIRATIHDDYADAYAIKEQLFDGVDEETFNALVEQGRAIDV